MHDVDIVKVPRSTVAVRHFHVAADAIGTVGDAVGTTIGEVMAELASAGVQPSGPPLASYQMDADGFDVAAGFPVPSSTVAPGVEVIVREAVEAAHTTHVGPYEDLPSAYEDLQRRAHDLGKDVDFRGPMWEQYWSPPETPPAQTRTEIFWPVESED